MGLYILANEGGLVLYRVDNEMWPYCADGPCTADILERKIFWIIRNRPGLIRFFPGIVMEEEPCELKK